jgi:hypothetical protein
MTGSFSALHDITLHATCSSTTANRICPADSLMMEGHELQSAFLKPCSRVIQWPTQASPLFRLQCRSAYSCTGHCISVPLIAKLLTAWQDCTEWMDGST